MTQKLYEKLRKIKESEAIRAWEYRQRHHSKGVWFRLREALAQAESAWAIDVEDASLMRAAGAQPLPVGMELHPSKNIFLIAPSELSKLVSRRRLAMHLSAELLAAENLVLVPFPTLKTQ